MPAHHRVTRPTNPSEVLLHLRRRLDGMGFKCSYNSGTSESRNLPHKLEARRNCNVPTGVPATLRKNGFRIRAATLAHLRKPPATPHIRCGDLSVPGAENFRAAQHPCCTPRIKFSIRCMRRHRILLRSHAPEFRAGCREWKRNGLRIIRQCERNYRQPISGKEVCGFLNFMQVIRVSADGKPAIGRTAGERQERRPRQQHQRIIESDAALSASFVYHRWKGPTHNNPRQPFRRHHQR